jgi:hypothetical protein
MVWLQTKGGGALPRGLLKKEIYLRSSLSYDSPRRGSGSRQGEGEVMAAISPPLPPPPPCRAVYVPDPAVWTVREPAVRASSVPDALIAIP